MIANSAFLAALTTFVIAAWLAAELTFLAPYKAAIFRTYGVELAGATVDGAELGRFVEGMSAVYGGEITIARDGQKFEI